MEFDIMTAIGQVGFPIAVTCYLLYQASKTNDVTSKLTEAINANTLMIEELRKDADELKQVVK